MNEISNWNDWDLGDGLVVQVDLQSPKVANTVMLSSSSGIPTLYFGYFSVFASEEAKAHPRADEQIAVDIQKVQLVAKVALAPNAIEAIKAIAAQL